MATNRSSRACRQPYRSRPEPGRASELARLENAVVAIARSEDLDERTKLTLLDPLLNQWTMIDGKYGARYRSIPVFSDHEFQIEHDHVWTRRSLKRILLGDRAEGILRATLRYLAVGCVLTRSEHDELAAIDRNPDTEHLVGWARYEEAGVLVVDMATLRVETGPLAGRPFDWSTGSIVPPSFEEILTGTWPAEELAQ